MYSNTFSYTTYFSCIELVSSQLSPDFLIASTIEKIDNYTFHCVIEKCQERATQRVGGTNPLMLVVLRPRNPVSLLQVNLLSVLVSASWS